MRLLFAVLAISTASLAQTTPTPLVVDAATAQLHILHRYEPMYPPIALAAHVSGDVKLQFEIDTQGHVVGLRVVSGPAMLAGAALDAVRHWDYTPFESDGHPVPVLSDVVVSFPSKLFKGSKLPEPVHIDMDDCTQALKDQKHPEKAVKPCDHAAAQAEKNPPSIRFEFSHAALESAAIADVHAGHPAEALSYLDTLASWIDESHSDDFAEISNVYSLRAQVRAVGGNAAGAEQDAASAEDAIRKALSWHPVPEKPVSLPAGVTALSPGIDYHATYTARLKETLKLHATLLSALGKKDEAQAKLDEAAKLN
jgi:TonB family protein